MIYSEKQPDPFTMGIYERILEKAPLDYLEATEKCCQDDLYFVIGAIPAECFDYYTLKFHYTNQ